MKPFRSRLCVSVALLACLAFVGCASLEQTSYRTIGSVTVTVDAAMNAWGDYVRSGRATASDEMHVREAYTRYQASMIVLKDAVLAAKQAQADNTPALQAAVNAVGASSADLVGLIKIFLPPDKTKTIPKLVLPAS